MIRRLLTMTVIAAAAAGAHAETHYEPHIAVGVHGGASVSCVSFAPTVQQGWMPWGTLGVSVSYSEEKLVGVLAEFNYESRGWNEKFENSPLHYSRTLHYLSVPVMTHIHFGGKKTKCIFNLGPEFSLLMGQNTSSNFDYHNPLDAEGWPKDEKRMTQQYGMEVKNRFDYGICAGAGCEYYLKPRTSVYLELRYYFGLGNIFPATRADVFSASRNMSLALTMGYNFRLK